MTNFRLSYQFSEKVLQIQWPEALQILRISNPKSRQDLRTCDEWSGFRTISRGLRLREIVRLRKSYQN